MIDRSALTIKAALGHRFQITTQMVLAGTLLRLPADQLEEVIQHELAENLALENEAWPQLNQSLRRARSSERTSAWTPGVRPVAPYNWQEAAPDESIARLAARPSPLAQLLEQAHYSVPVAHLEVVIALIHSLDKHGFLRCSEAELVREFGVDKERIRAGIAWLHQFEPPGVGARDLRECFLLQCSELKARGVDCEAAQRMIEQAWEHFSRQHWDAVARTSGLSRAEVNAALRFIRQNLYPYPLCLLAADSDERVRLARPDLVVHRISRAGVVHFTVEIPSAQTYLLCVSPAFQTVLCDGLDTESEAGKAWVSEAVERARTFIDALGHRWDTLRRIGEFLVTRQKDFFEHGARYLKPLTRAEVAVQLGVHESTISRAVSEKIVQLPNGRLMELSALFDRSLAAKEAIRKLIATESPLVDREIAERLREESIYLSRRTVAKYRRQLYIPATRHSQPT